MNLLRRRPPIETSPRNIPPGKLRGRPALEGIGLLLLRFILRRLGRTGGMTKATILTGLMALAEEIGRKGGQGISLIEIPADVILLMTLRPLLEGLGLQVEMRSGDPLVKAVLPVLGGTQLIENLSLPGMTTDG